MWVRRKFKKVLIKENFKFWELPLIFIKDYCFLFLVLCAFFLFKKVPKLLKYSFYSKRNYMFFNVLWFKMQLQKYKKYNVSNFSILKKNVRGAKVLTLNIKRYIRKVPNKKVGKTFILKKNRVFVVRKVYYRYLSVYDPREWWIQFKEKGIACLLNINIRSKIYKYFKNRFLKYLYILLQIILIFTLYKLLLILFEIIIILLFILSKKHIYIIFKFWRVYNIGKSRCFWFIKQILGFYGYMLFVILYIIKKGLKLIWNTIVYESFFIALDPESSRRKYEILTKKKLVMTASIFFKVKVMLLNNGFFIFGFWRYFKYTFNNEIIKKIGLLLFLETIFGYFYFFRNWSIRRIKLVSKAYFVKYIVAKMFYVFVYNFIIWYEKSYLFVLYKRLCIYFKQISMDFFFVICLCLYLCVFFFYYIKAKLTAYLYKIIYVLYIRYCTYYTYLTNVYIFVLPKLLITLVKQKYKRSLNTYNKYNNEYITHKLFSYRLTILKFYQPMVFGGENFIVGYLNIFGNKQTYRAFQWDFFSEDFLKGIFSKNKIQIRKLLNNQVFLAKAHVFLFQDINYNLIVMKQKLIEKKKMFSLFAKERKIIHIKNIMRTLLNITEQKVVTQTSFITELKRWMALYYVIVYDYDSSSIFDELEQLKFEDDIDKKEIGRLDFRLEQEIREAFSKEKYGAYVVDINSPKNFIEGLMNFGRLSEDLEKDEEELDVIWEHVDDIVMLEHKNHNALEKNKWEWWDLDLKQQLNDRIFEMFIHRVFSYEFKIDAEKQSYKDYILGDVLDSNFSNHLEYILDDEDSDCLSSSIEYDNINIYNILHQLNLDWISKLLLVKSRKIRSKQMYLLGSITSFKLLDNKFFRDSLLTFNFNKYYKKINKSFSDIVNVKITEGQWLYSLVIKIS